MKRPGQPRGNPAGGAPAPAASGRAGRGALGLRAPVSRRRYLAVAAASLAVLLVSWAVLSYGGFAKPVFLPTPGSVLERAGALWASGDLGRDLWVSNLRIIAGFLLATLVAVPLGMLAGNIRLAEAALEPLLGFLRYMPVPAFIPLLMLYTGIGETPKILVIFIGTVVQQTVMVADIARQAPADLIRAALALGANGREVFTRVIWPFSLPGIVDVMRTNLGFAWTYLVVAELVAANEGLGYRILKSQRFLQTDTIFLYLFIIGALGLASDMAFKQLQQRAFRWAEQKVST